MKNRIITLFTLILISGILTAQTDNNRSFSFAYLADTHIAVDSKTVTEVTKCVEDINNNPGLSFVIIAGDITEFGSDKEIRLAKSIFDKLDKPYYIIAGNHDSKWSESGCNTFSKVFGYEHFEFDYQGVKFIGTNSGPNMRMAPALMPRESVILLDSIAKNIDKKQPVIFINHFPQDTSMLNYFEVLDVLKTVNVQLVMGGHWHRDVSLNYEGIPGMLGRSTQASGRDGIGYNIVTIQNDNIAICEKLVGENMRASWFALKMSQNKPFNERMAEDLKNGGDPKKYALGLRPDYSVNKRYSNVQEIWSIHDDSDIGVGAVSAGSLVIYANTAGYVKALDRATGNEVWSYKTGGKIFSTPAVDRNRVVIGSTDNIIYCFDLNNGDLIWRHHCDKSVLGSPTIHNKVVYIGSSDNRFRALNLSDGTMVWNYSKIKGFIEAKPYVDDQQVVIGDWANMLYSFDPKTGNLQWTWTNKKGRMYSPAAVWPVKGNGKIFIVTPERVMYSIEASSGVQQWSVKGGRESIGISADANKVFVKTMKDTVYAVSANTKRPQTLWRSHVAFGYDIAPTPITTEALQKKQNEKDLLVFIPTDKGEIIALNSYDGSVAWRHKFSFALINYIEPLPGKQILVSSMDGKVAILKY